MNNFKQLEIKTTKSNGAVEKGIVENPQDPGSLQIPMITPLGTPRTFGQSMYTATTLRLRLQLIFK